MTTYRMVTPELKDEIAASSGSKAHTFIVLDDNHLSVAAYAEGKPIGLVAAKKRPLPPPLESHLEVYVDVIEVDPAYQRQEIATELMRKVSGWAERIGAIQLHAWSEDIRVEALPLWNRLGFAFSNVEFTRDGEKRYGFYVSKRIE